MEAAREEEIERKNEMKKWRQLLDAMATKFTLEELYRRVRKVERYADIVHAEHNNLLEKERVAGEVQQAAGAFLADLVQYNTLNASERGSELHETKPIDFSKTLPAIKPKTSHTERKMVDFEVIDVEEEDAREGLHSDPPMAREDLEATKHPATSEIDATADKAQDVSQLNYTDANLTATELLMSRREDGKSPTMTIDELTHI